MKCDKRLLRQIRDVRTYLVVTIGLSSVIGMLIVAQAHYLSSIINGEFLAGQTLDQVKVLLLSLLVVIVARAALVWGSEVTANHIVGQVKTKLRERLFAHLLSLGPAYTKGERSGELTNTVVQGVESLDAYFSQYLPQLFLMILVPLIIVIAVFSVDALSGLMLLLTAPLLPLFMILIGMVADTLTKRQWRLLSLMSAHFLDVLQGLTTLKLFGRSHAQQEIIRRISDRFRHTTMKVLRVAFLSSLVLEMGASISTAIIAVEVGLRLLYGHMGFEQAFFVLLLAPEFYLPLRTLGTRYHAAMTGEASAQRIFEVLETSNPVETRLVGPSPGGLIVPLSGGNIRFEDVHYAYDDQRPALKEVAFQVLAGQKVALVGSSGAGKSTVAHLLLRFIDPDSGRVCVNGTSLQDVPAQDWRRYVAWVPQHPYLFNATVAENIHFGCPEATLTEVIVAAQQAHAHEFIQALPRGYDTMIGERGTRLSGGQAQRLSLARAFLKNAPLLILDEATSYLDPENETLVLGATERLMRGRTVLIIAHRLSTVSNADQIVVMQEGRVVEVGTHESLLQQVGLYKQLVHAHEGNGNGREGV
jgi:ATP-binding cassette, subfamily C, bacterial CydD